jgi:hypothetical protein
MNSTKTTIRVFHGTGYYALDAIIRQGLKTAKHGHVAKACACTSLDFDIAQLFAVRRTPSDDFIAGKISGVVLEFEVNGLLDRDYSPVRDSHSLQEEQEIAIFSPKCLRLVAVWRHDLKWARHLLD